jgi:predicted ATPase
MNISEELVSQAVNAVYDDTSLTNDVKAVLLGALSGPTDLQAVLSSVPGADPPLRGPDTEVADSGPGKLYLTRIAVEGLRGVANRVELNLSPGPGLVLVTAPNGAGKSSLAEGAEFALRGVSERSRRGLWREGVHNVHHQGPTEAEVTLRETAERADLCLGVRIREGDSSQELVRPDGWDELSARLNWDEHIELHMPLMTYADLERQSSRPSDLYDAISSLLGLDGLVAADGALTAARTEMRGVGTSANRSLKELLPVLEGSDDPRADLLGTALKKPLDLDAAHEILLTNAGAVSSGELATLGRWAELVGPDLEEISRFEAALRDALAAVEGQAAGASGRALRLVGILEAALAHREHDGESCPVCGVGVLDAAWVQEAAHQLAEARSAASAAAEANEELETARSNLQVAAMTVPLQVVSLSAVAGVDPTPVAQAVRALVDVFSETSGLDPGNAWERTSDTAAQNPDTTLLARIGVAAQTVATTVEVLVVQANQALAAAESAWLPVAERASATVAELKAARSAKIRELAMTAALDWLRPTAERLRDERLTRYSSHAVAIWNRLRENSNVTFSDVTLVGANTRRRADLGLSVDGTSAPQAVLSQGELAAFGLALFLPRSTAPESPFRFLIIDDPVQSLDPTKVDALAGVLSELSETHQVIVFTHDTRLKYALRRRSHPIRALTLDRGERSRLVIRQEEDPAEQFLRDADSLAKATEFPADLRAVAVAGACRDALDIAALAAARTVLISQGSSLNDVDRQLIAATDTRSRLALALLGNRNKSGVALTKRLEEMDPDFPKVVAACVEGVHEPDSQTARTLFQVTNRVVDRLRALT